MKFLVLATFLALLCLATAQPPIRPGNKVSPGANGTKHYCGHKPGVRATNSLLRPVSLSQKCSLADNFPLFCASPMHN